MTFKNAHWRRPWHVAGALFILGLLAGCGGGWTQPQTVTKQLSKQLGARFSFAPQLETDRYSVLVPFGRRYGPDTAIYVFKKGHAPSESVIRSYPAKKLSASSVVWDFQNRHWTTLTQFGHNVVLLYGTSDLNPCAHPAQPTDAWLLLESALGKSTQRHPVDGQTACGRLRAAAKAEPHLCRLTTPGQGFWPKTLWVKGLSCSAASTEILISGDQLDGQRGWSCAKAPICWRTPEVSPTVFQSHRLLLGKGYCRHAAFAPIGLPDATQVISGVGKEFC